MNGDRIRPSLHRVAVFVDTLRALVRDERRMRLRPAILKASRQFATIWLRGVLTGTINVAVNRTGYESSSRGRRLLVVSSLYSSAVGQDTDQLQRDHLGIWGLSPGAIAN